MTPYFFTVGDRKLFAAYHAAEGPRRTDTAVLFCNPFGQEAIRSHRMYRVLADRVAREGFAALRFDYSCTGDSAGACEEARLARWVEDTQAAEEELWRRSQAREVVVVGLRLGATIGLLAAALPARGGRRLVLWDPVVNGKEYLSSTAEAHVGFLAAAFRWTPDRVERSRGIRSRDDLSELVGFAVSPELRRDIAAVARPKVLHASRIALLADENASGISELAQQLGSQGVPTRHVPIEADAPWDSEEALNASTIPAVTLDRIISEVRSAA